MTRQSLDPRKRFAARSVVRDGLSESDALRYAGQWNLDSERAEDGMRYSVGYSAHAGYYVDSRRVECAA